MNRLLVTVFVLVSSLLFAPIASAQHPAQSSLIGKDYRRAVAALDKTDPVVGFALSVRRESALFIAGGGALIGVSLVFAGVDVLASQGRAAPFLVGFSVPAGLALIVSGVPGLLGSQRYFTHYLEGRHPQTRMGKLRLLRAWRMDLLKLRRDTGLLGSAFLGAITVLSGVVWAVRDSEGINGPTAATVYDPSDAVTTMSFFASSGATALFALFAQLEYEKESKRPHRAYVRVAGGLAPVLSREGAGLQASLTVAF